MDKSILIKIKKYIIIINVIIIFITTLNYYLNKNRFNIVDVYLDYTFKEKILIDEHEIFKIFTTSFLLNDLYFNKEIYKIKDLNHLRPIEKISLYINTNEQKLEFKFIIKDTKIFNIKYGDINKDLQEKNIEIINIFVNEILDQFHERVNIILTRKIKDLRYELEELKVFNDNNNTIVENSEKEIDLKKFESQKEIDLKKFELQKEISILSNSLNSLENGGKIIVSDTYTKKFRKNYFKTDEYILSVLIVLFLINILIININRIFR
jgi:hypothetical protein